MHTQNRQQLCDYIQNEVGFQAPTHSLRDSQVAHPELAQSSLLADLAFSRDLKRKAVQDDDQQAEDEQMMQEVQDRKVARSSATKKAQTLEGLVIRQMGIASQKAQTLRQHMSQKELEVADWKKAIANFEVQDDAMKSLSTRITTALDQALIGYKNEVEDFIATHLSESAVKVAEQAGEDVVGKIFEGWVDKYKELQARREVAALRDACSEASKLQKEIDKKLKQEMRMIKGKAGAGDAAIPAGPASSAQLPGIDTILDAMRVDPNVKKFSTLADHVLLHRAVFLNAEPIKEAAVSIGRVDYYKRQQKWVCDQMSKENLSVACVGIMKPIIAKDVAAPKKSTCLSWLTSTVSSSTPRSRGGRASSRTHFSS